MNRLASALLAIVLCTGLVSEASAKRVALIVGNSTYKSVSKLPNPVNDARAMAETLSRLGFETVDLKLDQDFTTFRRTLRSFARKAAGADLGLVFFAGHGIEIGGQNYLIPTDAELADSADVDFEAIPLSMVMGALDRVKKLKLVVLDACRDNPFASRMTTTGATRSIGRGLARVSPRGQNSLVAYAAREGTIARDGDGKHSPYVTALLAHIETPGLEIGFLFRKVRDAVVDKTGGQQEPFVYGSLSGEAIYLKSPGSRPTTTTTTTTTKPVKNLPTLGGATMAWEHVKDSNDIGLLRAFIAQYGATNAFYARLAESKIRKLEEKKITSVRPNVIEPPKPIIPRDDAYKVRGNCVKDIEDWRTRSSIGAFAVERGGACGWSYGFDTLKEARERALEECRKHGSDCKVVEVHTDKAGNWALGAKCKVDLANWRKKATIGAFAVERRGGCGWSYGFKSLTEARDRALAECRKQGSECIIIGVTTKKSGQWSLGSNCRRDLNNWRSKVSIGAFALERGGGCGWSFGFNDLKQAHERALAECANQGPNCEVIEVHTDNSGDYTLGSNCKRDLAAWRKKASIGAFAVEKRGGCGWSWSHKTVENARKSAMEACHRQGPNCKVIEVHTKQRGDWTLSSNCKTHLNKWRKLKRKGAFAVERAGGCGWSYGFKTLKSARSRAIVECRKQGPECKVLEVR